MKIGILGGMGPEATAELYLRIIRIYQEKFGARYDDDFPEIIVVSLPIPDVVESQDNEREVRRMLIRGVKTLEQAGACFVAIPCNTVTSYLPALRKEVMIPLLSIVDLTAMEIRKRGLSKVGILGTKKTIADGLYRNALGGIALTNLDATKQEETTGIIMDILSGKKSDCDRERLKALVQRLMDQGAEGVILGCTELPLLISGKDGCKESVIDTLDVLAEAVVAKATGTKMD